MRISSVLKARCPKCNEGKVLAGIFAIKPKCEVCEYNFHPEPGFYLGAMVVGYLLTAMVTIPPMVVFKVLGFSTVFLVMFPLVEFIFVGTFVIFYCRILWLHLEYQMTSRLNSKDQS
jgi:uncharacterized protein (DUF983 family)